MCSSSTAGSLRREHRCLFSGARSFAFNYPRISASRCRVPYASERRAERWADAAHLGWVCIQGLHVGSVRVGCRLRNADAVILYGYADCTKNVDSFARTFSNDEAVGKLSLTGSSCVSVIARVPPSCRYYRARSARDHEDSAEDEVYVHDLHSQRRIELPLALVCACNIPPMRARGSRSSSDRMRVRALRVPAGKARHRERMDERLIPVHYETWSSSGRILLSTSSPRIAMRMAS
jgi:hypothetical protein